MAQPSVLQPVTTKAISQT